MVLTGGACCEVFQVSIYFIFIYIILYYLVRDSIYFGIAHLLGQIDFIIKILAIDYKGRKLVVSEISPDIRSKKQLIKLGQKISICSTSLMTCTNILLNSFGSGWGNILSFNSE